MSNVYNYDIELLSRVNLPDAVDFTQGITIHAGYYWMTSNRYKTVSKLTLDLDVLYTFSVESQTDLPLGIAHDGEHLWIVGTDKDKVLKYTEQGVYTGVSFSTLAQVALADGICWDGYHFWVVGTGNFNAYKYTHDGVYTGVNFPLQIVDGTVRDITWDGDSFWVISNTSTGGKINRYNADGSYESDEFESIPAHGIYYYGEQLHAVGSASSELFIYSVKNLADPIVNLLLSLSSISWGNRETRAQAKPQPIYLEHHGIVPFDSTYAVKNNPFYADPIVDQNSKLREFGYIASTTQVGGVPIGNKRVMLFAHDNGMLLDETVSDSAGNYRFDSLLMSKKYMVTAQYGNADEHTPPEYNATSSDWQTPTKYGEE